MEKTLFIASALAVLMPTGFCLSCYQCTINEQYKCVGAYKLCAKKEVCFTAFATTAQSGPFVVGRICATANKCDQSFSYLINGQKATISTSCCKTNKCKPAPQVKKNALKCPFCVADESGSCIADQTYECTGPEDKCFSYYSAGPRKQLLARGCASSNICNTPLKNTIVPPVYQNGKAICEDEESDQTDDAGDEDDSR
ncbi:uncharacterized protein LOC108697054 [Xenopus laevis]|uniref:Uncharacterized protein LOC108697054 n=2 Tax=Xenopus laevis TaxID=8355 RepID=A0A1L8FNW9_XENLA|nr:uncharacterized protein LOC108697054 [Xenopus laevis]OCT73280.1 hypothetical protein XELAEV_18036260mg [Xenopus laevis]